MSKSTITKSESKINPSGGFQVCTSQDCPHNGEPQPVKLFRGRRGVTYSECRDCRWPRYRQQRLENGLNGYAPPRPVGFVLPPGCAAAWPESWWGVRYGDGDGVPILTDPAGRAVIKTGVCRPGEVCLVVR